MPAPFYNAVKSGTDAAPGTGALTPNATAVGNYYRWADIPPGIFLVLFKDGASEELAYAYWNGTTLSRATGQIVRSTNANALVNFTAATVTAEMVADASEVQPHLATTPFSGWRAQPGTNGQNGIGLNLPTTGGTTGAAAVAATNFLTEQPRHQTSSATTANAQAAWTHTVITAVYSTTAGRGGFEFVARFGASALPTGPRLFCGMTSVSGIGLTTEPSAWVASIAGLAKDSTDTNFQFLTNDNSGGGNKTDTGIAWAANGWYEFTVSAEPGGGAVTFLLLRLDTGAIFRATTATQLPANGALLSPNLIGGLSATTGTAVVMHSGGYFVRSGA